MIKCISSSPVKEWRVDELSEVQNVPVGDIGDTVYVVNTGEVYMSNGTAWQEQ